MNSNFICYPFIHTSMPVYKGAIIIYHHAGVIEIWGRGNRIKPPSTGWEGGHKIMLQKSGGYKNYQPKVGGSYLLFFNNQINFLAPFAQMLPTLNIKRNAKQFPQAPLRLHPHVLNVLDMQMRSRLHMQIRHVPPTTWLINKQINQMAN